VALEEAIRSGDWLMMNKADIAMLATVWMPPSEALSRARPEGCSLSAHSWRQFDGLRAPWPSHVADALSGAEFPAATRLRHAERLKEARDYLGRALSEVGLEVELAAEDVRLAARALEKITGRVDPEDVLGRVFSTFCIGK
jgi:tRNA modification GTPase